jgi:hypothetical protein
LPLVSITDLTQASYTLSEFQALSYGTYYWRVKAIDGAGNDSGWTAANFFKAGALPLWSFIVIIVVVVAVISVLVYYFRLRRRPLYE